MGESDLSSLKKGRGLIRTSLTKCFKKIEDEADSSKMSGLLECMRLRFEELTVMDNTIFSIMSKDPEVSEADLEKEHDDIDRYTVLYYQGKSLVESKVQVKNEGESSHYDSVKCETTNYQCKLPTLKLREFSGNLSDWLPFWSQFEKIDSDPKMNPSDKLGYLTMSMTADSPARQLVDSYPATGEMYDKVVKTLKQRYGREDLLTEYYIREMLKLVLENSKQKLDIVSLHDKLLCHIRNLESLGVTTKNCGPILMPLVSSCLPEDIMQMWERVTRDDSSSTDKLESLLTFLKREVESSQKLALVKSGFGLSTPSPKGNVKPHMKPSQEKSSYTPTASGLFNTHVNIECIFCQAEHKPQDCKVDMPLQARIDIVKKKKVCFSCLRTGHHAARCRRRPKCNKCGRGHYMLLCDPGLSNSQETGTDNIKFKPSQNASMTSATYSNVLMQTLVIKVCGKNGRTKETRLLFDTGSQRSYMLSSLAREMGYNPKGKERIQHALFGGKVTEAAEHNIYQLRLANIDKSFTCDFEVLEQDKICADIPSVPTGPWIGQLKAKSITLSDVNNQSEIEVLVGSDIAAKLWTGDNFDLNNGLVAMETKLGWTLSGKVPGAPKRDKSVASIVTSLLLKDAKISDLWSLDVLGITDPMECKLRTEIDRATEEHFRSTVQLNKDNRFEIRLPFTNDHPPLSSNYSVAKLRLQSTVKKLKADGYLDSYEEVLSGWEQQGIIEEVPISEIGNPAHYLPHRHVIKEGSTTPVRPVFDASSKEVGSHSLNDCLEKGPNLIEKIPAALAKFRKNKIGISGDIAKAFLQISVNPKDRDYLRFLWQSNGQIKTYRHCRVVFGVSSSPFLLESCLKLHLEDTMKLCQEGKLDWSLPEVEILSDSFYVDNCLVSVHSEVQAKDFIHMASNVMMERGFDLRGWEQTGDDHDKPTNVLGLLWNKFNDTLTINLDRLLSMKFDIVTKKVLLSAAHRLFDPIGIVSSVALIPKLLVQETWRQNLSWNEEVAEDTKDKFYQWLSEVPLLAEVCIPRWIADCELEDAECQIHVFSDACKFSYASCVFLRIEHKNGVTLRLLASKAKVAPVPKAGKDMTIPRLELLAASIAARLYQTVINDYKLSDMKTYFWTDASTVLAWIHRDDPWDVYVMNRVKEIRSLTQGCEWRHVPGNLNPADLPSRGSSVKKLLQCRWWEGPVWLKENPEQWPQPAVTYDEAEILKERKRTVVSSMLVQEEEPLKWYEYFSQYPKIIRMIAWMMRFIKNCKLKREERSLQNLSASEIILAEQKVFMLVQKESFKDMSKLKHLMTFEQNDVIRIKTKISNREDDNDFCYPIVLPSEHPVVQRMIMFVHRDNCHAGGQILLSILRQRFWILGGRRTIRSVINTCVICKRQTAKKMEVTPTPLPENRVRNAKVFEITGVDLAGPLFIKGDDGKMKKIWICLFTCAVYRAVRLEIISSLSTDSFILTLRRFCARQGRPSIIYSDNGSNFVGFDGVCVKLDWHSIADYSTARRIEWRFNPPASPWWGGWWERLVGVMKGMLKRVLGRSSVNYEELQTIVCDCEAIINQRPLTYVSDNPQELTPITPSMFLKDIEEVGMPEFHFFGSEYFQKRVKYRQELAKSLRERFRCEYLGQLQLFVNQRNQRSIRQGEIVLIGDDNAKRIDWPIGRVTELIHGNDGHVRVVKIRTKNGELTRPLQRVYPLELEYNPEEISSVSDVAPDIESSDDNIADVSVSSNEPVSDVLTGNDKDPNDKIGEIKPTINQVTRRGRCIRKPSRFV